MEKIMEAQTIKNIVATGELAYRKARMIAVMAKGLVGANTNPRATKPISSKDIVIPLCCN